MESADIPQQVQERRPAPSHVTSDLVASYGNLQFRINHRDTNTVLVLDLPEGHQIQARSGCMIAVSGTVKIKGKYDISLKKIFTGDQIAETFFTGPGEVLLAPDIWGDIAPLRLDGETTWHMTKSSYIASSGEGLQKKMRSQGLGKGLFSGDGLFVYEVWGQGIIWIQAIGAIIKKQLAADEEWVMDSGHMVAWSCDYKPERIKAGGFFAKGATEEPFVCRFKGPGAIYIQTRNARAIGHWINEQVQN